MVTILRTRRVQCCTIHLRTRRVLLLYKVCGTIQWYYFENQKVKVLLLYKVCGTIQWYYFENQKGAIVVQSLWYYSMVLFWEPEGCYCCTKSVVLFNGNYFENQKGAIVVQSLWYYSMVLFWEPEGCYCCTKSVVLFNGTILRTRRVLLLYKVCGTIQWYYFENQKGAIVVQSLWYYSMVLFWEPEGCYCCTKSVVLFNGTYFENQKGAIVVQSLWYYSMVLFWEPEGCYCCTKSVVLFNGTILRTRRVLLLYKVCGTIQWYYFENQKGAIVVQSLWWYHPSGSQRSIVE